MAIVEKIPSAVETQTAAKPEAADEVVYRAYPDMERSVDYPTKTITIEVSLPGVKKDAIHLKVLPTWFHLKAQRGRMEYSANPSFGVEVIPEKTTAKYENGLLLIIAHIRDPLDSAKEVQF